jgi:hypothetical protein
MNGANGANGHAVEIASLLIENGVTAAKTRLHEQPEIHDLDASKLKVTRTNSPRKVPEPNSAEIWDMKTCTDHSEYFERNSCLITINPRAVATCRSLDTESISEYY